ncbi:hypothetical protein KFK09_015109 [Dendrobium nobile]|uniref:Uncharacterized protein n=1 Tax=Dendrobium nobile TaxID=94219 RepID=A0A8T3B3W4_DENNO|nr:hypothetical protein KFK09_015109 [Dendrobium nobile]
MVDSSSALAVWHQGMAWNASGKTVVVLSKTSYSTASFTNVAATIRTYFYLVVLLHILTFSQIPCNSRILRHLFAICLQSHYWLCSL